MFIIESIHSMLEQIMCGSHIVDNEIVFSYSDVFESHAASIIFGMDLNCVDIGDELPDLVYILS